MCRQSLRLTVAVALSVALIRLGCSNGFTQDCDGVRKSSRSVNFTAPENAIDTYGKWTFEDSLRADGGV